METSSNPKLVSPFPTDVHNALRHAASLITGAICLQYLPSYDLLPVLSAVLTVTCISIILRMSRNTSPAYAKLLLIVTIFPITSDFIFTFLFDPAPLIPLPCLLRWDPIVHLPGNVTIYYTIWVTIICWNAAAYGACFIHRHQAVVPPGYPGRFSFKTRVIFLSWMTTVFTMCGPILLFARYPGDYSMLKNNTIGFTDAQLRRVDCYEIHKLFIFIGYCFSIFGICFCFLVTPLLRDTERIPMSDKTRSYHRVMTGSLVVQTLVPIVFLFIPLCSCFIIFIVGWDISILYPLSLVSIHSPMHSIVLIAFTPVYRKDFLHLISFGRLAGNHQKRSSLRASTSRP